MTSTIDWDDIQEASDRVDLEAWFDHEGIDYKRTRGSSGLQLNVKECPVCGNSKWKVYLNAESGLGNCFHGDCEAKFNKFKFIRSHFSDLSFGDVIFQIKDFARQAGWRPKARQPVAQKEVQLELCLPDSIALPYMGRNLKYLDERGISGQVAKYFDLRFCLRGHFDYKDEHGLKKKQHYNNRVIIPIFDLGGRLVSFQGRDTTGNSDKKYLFPPGFASTGEHLYNGQNAVGATTVVIGEGVFDVAAIKAAIDKDANFKNIVPVGSFGKHLSHGDDNSQLAKLIKLAEMGLRNVIFMWDGEERATDDAVRAALMVKSHGFNVKVAMLPKDKDPNEVPAKVVLDALYKAELVTPAIGAKMKLLRRMS